MEQTPVIEVYMEDTPNPQSRKFLTNRHILPNFQLDFRSPEMAGGSALAQAMFALPFVSGVFISNNFVTITKAPDADWLEISPLIRQTLQQFLQSGQKPVDDALLPRDLTTQPSGADDAETKIRELLEKYVKPAIQMDGGHIEFRSFRDGVVTLALQGSCSGCPSSKITLKSGIEGLLKRMVPEVREVVAEEE